MMIALQTLDQMDKNPFLSYLKGIILNSCGFHVVFGRTNINDQMTYSSLAGMVDKVVKSSGVSQTALSSDNPQYTMSDRFTVEQVEVAPAHTIRNKDFQEVTFFRVEAGKAMPPVHGRVDFLKKKDKQPIRRYKVDWETLRQQQNVVKKFQASVPVKETIYKSTAELPENSLSEMLTESRSEVSVSLSTKQKFNISEAAVTNINENNNKERSEVVMNIKAEVPASQPEIEVSLVNNINTDEHEAVVIDTVVDNIFIKNTNEEIINKKIPTNKI